MNSPSPVGVAAAETATADMVEDVTVAEAGGDMGVGVTVDMVAVADATADMVVGGTAMAAGIVTVVMEVGETATEALTAETITKLGPV